MTKQEAKRAFEKGKVPKTQIFGGDGTSSQWRVDMLSGPIPSMGGWPLYHRKSFLMFFYGNHHVVGVNRMCKWLEWGWFNLSGGELSYATAQNGFFTRHIRDAIRTTESPDVLVGKFFLQIFHRRIFLGYFTLTRIST